MALGETESFEKATEYRKDASMIIAWRVILCL